MQPAKQDALETIGKLPDDADMEQIMYRLYVLDKSARTSRPPTRAAPPAARN